ncbi:MAG: hypothetical protein HKM93_23580 [Desulfobacteraceae bacterium]|nr:hypothetical protein [Desulfobacteraceae bacterium]
MKPYTLLDIFGQGAWNGGTLVDNTNFEKLAMAFKGGIPVTDESIRDRIGVRTRISAPEDVRIGEIALQNLLDEVEMDPERIKLIIGATNVGEDKQDPGPLVKHPHAQIKDRCPNATALDLYAGCPGFNVAVELLFMLSLGGILKKDDISIIVGAENLHRAKAFQSHDTATIIFGDDAVATALKTRTTVRPQGSHTCGDRITIPVSDTFVEDIAAVLCERVGSANWDGIIVDNQLGRIEHRAPAIAARIQQAFVEKQYPEMAAAGIFGKFRDALAFYDQHINAFAFDIMSLDKDPGFVEKIGRAYTESGKYSDILTIYLDPETGIVIQHHHGRKYRFQPPAYGIIDTATRTHGCFGSFIQAITVGGEVFGEMDGKGVFLYATRGAAAHLSALLMRNQLSIADIDLLVEHQANFAMLPMTLLQLLAESPDPDLAVREFLADKMVTNIHTRGNCSVVCMQRLPYDLHRDALEPDEIQGFPVNRNLAALKNAGNILHDSVGAGMTRSSFLRRVKTTPE